MAVWQRNIQLQQSCERHFEIGTDMRLIIHLGADFNEKFVILKGM